MDLNSIYETAYEIYEHNLKKFEEEKKEISTNEAIEKSINSTLNAVSNLVNNDIEPLKAYLNSRISREREEEIPKIILGEEAEKSTWWFDFKKMNENNLKYWDRYRDYLRKEKKWENSAINKSINNTTDKLLNSLADPNSRIEQEKRAMVVGYVQSGKTANYIGLINKALDAGYKYIIILAGMHNNLRSQTQARIDEEVLGYETDSMARQRQRERAQTNKIGVGKIYNAGFVQTLTFRDENGDFKKSRLGIQTSPEVPTIVVTKKTKSTLENLINNIKSNIEISKDKETEEFYMSLKYPLLLIDDEADQASVNTGYKYDDNENIIDEYSVKTINRLIRELFNLFKVRSYVGYTATPYANIFIPNNISEASKEFGNDLFPGDCIISLPKPYKYIGANEFFGYGNEEDLSPMPLIREINDDNFIDKKRKKVNDLPNSLKKAIKSFLISIAIRNIRGEKYKPNTMLIHVARFVSMHEEVERKVSEYFYDELQNMIIDNDKKTKEEIYNIISEDYIPTTKEMQNEFSRYMQGSTLYDIDEVYNEIKRLMNEEKVVVKVINGDSKDFLAYKENKNNEYNVIAIGGDKFSRGLTLEGLSVSYFTRESKYYDTLMQMGRWFGFKDKYADLCRVYTTEELYKWFARIAFATDNLRNQISYMCDQGSKPSEFGLRVATHPDLKISNPQKIKTGSIQNINFSNTLTITRDIDVDKEIYEDNYNAINKLFLDADKIYTSEEHFNNLGRKPIGNYYFLDNIPGFRIVQFLREYKTSKHANKVNGNNIASYIEGQLNDNNEEYLTNWTVALYNGGTPERINIAGKKIGGGIVRNGKNSLQFFEDKDPKVCSIHMLKSKDQEFMGLNNEEFEKVMNLRKYLKDKGESNISNKIRRTFNKSKGLLIIYPIDFENSECETRCFKIGNGDHKHPFGLVIVFPEGNGKSVSYRLNPIASKGMDEYDLFD